jgi:molecular chaperone DnaK (HSP70)
VESVFQDIDFKTKITRQQLEEMFKEFEERMMAPINQGMEMAKLDDKEKLDKVMDGNFQNGNLYQINSRFC